MHEQVITAHSEVSPEQEQQPIKQVSQLLSTVQAFASLFRAHATDPSQVNDLASHLERTVNRAQSSLKSSVHTPPGELPRHGQPLDLESAATEALNTLRRLAHPGITIQLDHAKESPKVLANASEVHVLLLLLGLRALESIGPSAGTLSLTVEPYEINEPEARRLPGLEAGPYARLKLTDSGASLDTEFVQHSLATIPSAAEASNPISSILSAARRLVVTLNGALEIDCGTETGNTLLVFLPAYSQTTSMGIIPPGVPAGRGEHVLFVDDDHDLAQAAAQLLPALGYTAHVYTEPEKALEDLQENKDLCEVAVLDLNMPRMTGIDLATQILEVRPGTPVYLMTGMRGEWTPEMARNLGIRGVLNKPMSPAMWCLALHQALHPDFEPPASLQQSTV